MKLENFAKIIEMPVGHVLVTRDWDGEDESPKVTAHLQIEGARLSVGFGFTTDEAADEAFGKFGAEQATAVFEDIVNKFSS